MVTVHLHGDLGAKYGALFEFDIRTSVEAIRALCANFPGFRQDFERQDWVVRVGERKTSLSLEEIPMASCRGEVHFIPAVTGAKDANDQILLGVGLIALAIFVPMAAGTSLTALKAGTFAAFMAQTTLQLGVGLALSGLASKIMAPNDPNAAEGPRGRTTGEFNGPVNTMAQGRCVPVGYGRRIVGSHVISAGISNEDEVW